MTELTELQKRYIASIVQELRTLSLLVRMNGEMMPDTRRLSRGELTELVDRVRKTGTVKRTLARRCKTA